MNKRGKKKPYLIVLIILMTAFYMQPLGVHIELCFGEDGHFDFMPVPCNVNEQLPFEDHADDDSEDHHGNCTDIKLFCDGNLSCILNSSLLISNSTPNDLQNIPVLEVANITTQTTDNGFQYNGFVSERCNYIPPFLNSTILLI